MDLEIQIVNVEGLDELEEALTEGSQRAVRKFLARVEKRAAKILKDAASADAPYDQGDLSEDIHMSVSMSDGALTVRVGPGRKTFYGQFQEFGAPEANVPAQHWLEMAAKSVQQAVLEEYFAALTEGLEAMKK